MERPNNPEADKDPIRRAVEKRFGQDAQFYYELKDGQVVIMNLDDAFVVSGGHIRQAFLGARSAEAAEDKKAAVEAVFDGLTGLKEKADTIRATDSDEYDELVIAGEQFMADFLAEA